MFKNIYYDTKKSVIHLWEQIDGENLPDKIEWTPYLYLPTENEDQIDAQTIFGDPVHKRTFQSYSNYSKFLQENKNPIISENNVRNEIQFLAERYHGIPDDEMEVPKLKVYYLDIEVIPKEGFPSTKNPQDPVVLISIRDSINKRTFTFGYDPFYNRYYDSDLYAEYKKPDDVKYIMCKDEEELLRRFFNFMNKFPCDVLSGYNIWSFDLPYLINRANVLFGEDKGKKYYRRLSPINIVNIWKQKSQDAINIDIAGMTILDYYDVYKWYGKNLERYTLEYVCQTELGVGKLPNPYGSLNQLAEEDWQRYTDYNIIDCERVNDLEDQLGYIKMIQALSLLCKSPMKNYNTQTQLIEGLMLTYYRRNGLCAPYFAGGEQKQFPAAYVKEPQKGMHEWVVDVDITSSYPSHIITLNMSVETFLGRISRMQEESVIDYTRKREFPPFKMLRENEGEWTLDEFNGNRLKVFNHSLKLGLLAIAPCGSVFTTKTPGVISKVERAVFDKRKEVKGKKKEWDLKAKECTGEERTHCLEKKMQAHSLQLALKIMMNAFFGILSVPYSRYHNIHIAEAITSCGRYTIRSGEKFCNDLLNDPNDDLLSMFPANQFTKRGHKKDYVAYIDTDSLFVRLGQWIEDRGYKEEWNVLDDNEKVEVIKKISASTERYIDDRIFNEVQLGDYNSQVHDFKIGFKQEIIAKTALFVKKKKYAYWLLNDEGISTDKIKVTGLEIVRSDSSEAIRPRLKHIMEMIMKQKTDEEISNQIRKYEKELRQLDPEALAANIGINNIRKYLKTGSPIKGTPWHIKGVHNYRLLLKELGIENKYEDIKEGLKAKVIYAKKNPFNVDTITFNEWPTEFDRIIQYNSDIMIEKFFIKKVRLLLNPIDKEAIIDSDMDAFKAFF